MIIRTLRQKQHFNDLNTVGKKKIHIVFFIASPLLNKMANIGMDICQIPRVDFIKDISISI